MDPDISIIIPHKRGLQNNKALLLNLQMLQENTNCNYELIIDTTAPKDVYKIWNEASKQARAKVLVFSNSDVLMARDWDVLFLKHIQDNTIVTGYIIEPGNIGVAECNIQQNFGKSPNEFDREMFESFAVEHRKILADKGGLVREERAWYMPCAMMRDWFVWTGGFDTTLGFPNPNDILFWNKCIENFGTKTLHVASYSYHFQNLSGRD